MHHYYYDDHVYSNEKGEIYYDNKPKVTGVKPNSCYKVHVDYSYCAGSENEEDKCNRSEEGFTIPQFWYRPNGQIDKAEGLEDE